MRHEIELSNVLVVIDMQNDFIDGSLGSEDARSIVDNVVNKINEYKASNRPICYTMDTHDDNYLNTFEGKNLPVKHCIQGTHGWDLNSKIKEVLERYPRAQRYIKHTFGTFDWLMEKFIITAGITVDIDMPDQSRLKYKSGSIEICGLCTDICVISNALIIRALCPNTPIYVDANSCAGTSKEAHESGLITMASNQIEVWSSKTGNNYIKERA